ncbi:MAG: hypothetical protein WAO83_18520 [Fuerstiella sp.]
MIRKLTLCLLAITAASDGVCQEHRMDIDVRVSNSDASLRGIKVVDQQTVFATGSNSTVLRTINGGKTWTRLKVCEDAELDFRDVESATVGSLILMSAGPGEKSRIFRSTNGGDSWSLVHRNEEPMGFFNGMAFSKDGRGLLVGDPIDGRLFLLETSNFGATWTPLEGPETREGEYGFAASGTGIVMGTDGHAWIATGAASSRVFHTEDFGKSWSVAATPIRSGEPSEGIFSGAFHENRFGVIVGGDYKQPFVSNSNCATSSNGGKTWSLAKVEMPHKACVRFLDDSKVLAVGRTGIMLSTNRGQTWKMIADESFYTFDVERLTGTVFLAGGDGRVAIGRLRPK